MIIRDRMLWRIKKWIRIHKGTLHPVVLEYKITPTPRYGWGKHSHPLVEAKLAEEKECFHALFADFMELKDGIPNIPAERTGDAAQPYWHNGWLGILDSLSIYGFIAKRKPKHYFEIGSGNSTKFAHRAKLDYSPFTIITSIDPTPRAEIDALCDTIIRKPLESVDFDVFSSLTEGDVLFFDGSHYVFQNSDVTAFFLDVLPAIPPGVLIGFHDIFLPDDYPPSWRGRFYAEQYMLACLLINDPNRYKCIFPAHYISLNARYQPIIEAFKETTSTGVKEVSGTSFWIEKQPVLHRQ